MLVIYAILATVLFAIQWRRATKLDQELESLEIKLRRALDHTTIINPLDLPSSAEGSLKLPPLKEHSMNFDPVPTKPMRYGDENPHRPTKEKTIKYVQIRPGHYDGR